MRLKKTADGPEYFILSEREKLPLGPSKIQGQPLKSRARKVKNQANQLSLFLSSSYELAARSTTEDVGLIMPPMVP